MAGAQTLANGSDNILVDGFMDPTLGCTPFQAPDLANAPADASQALDELPAAGNQPASIALVPENDEMVLRQRRLQRGQDQPVPQQLGQPPISDANNQRQPGDVLPEHGQHPDAVPGGQPDAAGNRPVAGDRDGNNLLTFLANRLNMSFTNLGCQNFGLTNPVTVTLDGNGAAIAATFNTTVQQATAAAAGGGATGTGTPPNQRTGRPHHRFQNQGGM